MSLFIPDWAPNIHPLIIHFPIVLLMIAVILHVGTLAFPRAVWLKTVTPYTFIIGTATALITYFTGRVAADSVYLPPDANPVLSSHSDYAFFTIIVFGILTLIQLFVLLRKKRKAITLQLISFVLGISGLFLLVKTGEYGGKMVYKYGVGTAVTEMRMTALHTSEPNSDSAIVLLEDGSWYWNLTTNDIDSQFRGFKWLKGSQADIKISQLSGEIPGISISTISENASILLEAGEITEGIQVNVSLNMDNFDGTFFIIHHIRKNTYDYLSFNGLIVSLGRSEEGKKIVLQEKEIESMGRISIQLVGAGRHQRGYLNGKLETHAHIDELPQGTVGFGLEGKGTIRINEFQVLKLKDE
jgi:uncharacterized membrane protein